MPAFMCGACACPCKCVVPVQLHGGRMPPQRMPPLHLLGWWVMLWTWCRQFRWHECRFLLDGLCWLLAGLLARCGMQEPLRQPLLGCQACPGCVKLRESTWRPGTGPILFPARRMPQCDCEGLPVSKVAPSCACMPSLVLAQPWPAALLLAAEHAHTYLRVTP